MSAPIALALITHNSAQFLPTFAQSWQATLAAAVGGLKNSISQVETHIADSASTDGTISLAQSLFPTPAIHRVPNRGLGAAANTALRVASAPWLLLCNPDLQFPADFLDTLFQNIPTENPARSAHAPKRKIACIAPRLLNPDHSLQPSVGPFPTFTTLLRDQLRPRPQRKYHNPQPTQPTIVDWATAACLLLHRESILSVGGFDEDYFLYGEEVDLQRRLHDAGFSTLFVPELSVIHRTPNASRPPRPEVQRYAARGTLRYFAKFAGPLTLTAYRLLALVSFRLPPSEAFASRKKILATPTGP